MAASNATTAAGRVRELAEANAVAERRLRACKVVDKISEYKDNISEV